MRILQYFLVIMVGMSGALQGMSRGEPGGPGFISGIMNNPGPVALCTVSVVWLARECIWRSRMKREDDVQKRKAEYNASKKTMEAIGRRWADELRLTEVTKALMTDQVLQKYGARDGSNALYEQQLRLDREALDKMQGIFSSNDRLTYEAMVKGVKNLHGTFNCQFAQEVKDDNALLRRLEAEKAEVDAKLRNQEAIGLLAKDVSDATTRVRHTMAAVVAQVSTVATDYAQERAWHKQQFDGVQARFDDQAQQLRSLHQGVGKAVDQVQLSVAQSRQVAEKLTKLAAAKPTKEAPAMPTAAAHPQPSAPEAPEQA